MRHGSFSGSHLIFVLQDQVVIPQLGEKGVRVLHAGHFSFLAVEKLQQILRFEEIQRVHRS